MVYINMKKTLWPMQLVRRFYKNIRRFVASGDEISELSRLIEENRLVVLKPHFQMNENEAARMTVHEVVKDYLEVYRVLWLRRSKMEQLAMPTGVVLLRYPLALLIIPSEHNKYLKTVGAKTRNMIRKAEKEGYYFEEFDWNKHLDDIFKINTSKDIRSAGAMAGWYRELVRPRHLTSEEQFYQKYYGIFKEGHLWAYLNLVLCGDFGFFKHFIGHSDHLRNGIMNYLVSCTVQEYVGHSHIKFLSYGIFPAGSKGSTIDFRKHAGFEGYATFLDLEDDQELLQCSRRVRARGLTNV